MTLRRVTVDSEHCPAYQPSGEKTIISPLTMLMSVSERVSSVTSSWLSGTVSRGVLDFHA
jgi:hypothetical protein